MWLRCVDRPGQLGADTSLTYVCRGGTGPGPGAIAHDVTLVIAYTGGGRLHPTLALRQGRWIAREQGPHVSTAGARTPIPVPTAHTGSAGNISQYLSRLVAAPIVREYTHLLTHAPCIGVPPCGREDIDSGSKDAFELNTRDRLRRNVQWMAGVAPLAPPTLSEMGKLLDKVRGCEAAFSGVHAFLFSVGRDYSRTNRIPSICPSSVSQP